MNILFYDCFTGISGDMNLGALLDVGVDPDYLKKELKKLKIDDEFELEILKSKKNGITGTKLNVIIKHHHQHNNHHAHSPHRHYADIKRMIEESDLSEFVKKHSIKTFEKVAVAEAKIHGTTVDKVHFHEVGATDSIVDIVGNAICIDYLKPDLMVSSPVQLGGGFVNCQHGTFPVPAPATVEILQNIPVKTGLVNDETTTPTGAAIIATNCTEFSGNYSFNILKTGYGLGTKEFEVPNVLRIIIAGKTNGNEKKCYVCECNIDDMNPEHYSYITEQLFEIGANDVYLSSIMMKKNRPANKLSILCKAAELNKIIDFILKETTSFGLRYFPVEKVELDRKMDCLIIDDVEINIKYAYLDGTMIKYKPEYEDCARFAKIKKISLAQVYKLVEKKISGK